MGFLDNAGLARFTAWVRERLAGKLDKAGGELTGDLSLANDKGITLKKKNTVSTQPNIVELTVKPGGFISYESPPGGGLGSSMAVPGIFYFNNGAQFNGAVSLSGNPLYCVAAPTRASDGANKGYVDTAVAGRVAGQGVNAIQAMTQAEYDALAEKVSTTLYVIKEEA